VQKGGKQQSKDEKKIVTQKIVRNDDTAAGSLTFDRCVQRESRRLSRETKYR
jgi:hypothetical protein